MAREIIVVTHDEYILTVPDGMTDAEAEEWAEDEVVQGHVDRNDGWTEFTFTAETGDDE